MRTHLLSLAAVVLSTMSAFAMSDTICARHSRALQGDRTGGLRRGGVIDDGGTTASASFCADRNPSAHTMSTRRSNRLRHQDDDRRAARRIHRARRVALNDPIAKLLPPGTTVPSFEAARSHRRHRHVTSWPAAFPWRMPDMNNPYAAFTEGDLLGALPRRG